MAKATLRLSKAKPALPKQATRADESYGATAEPDWRDIDWREHLHWALYCLWQGRLLASEPMALELLLTLAFYPFATLLLARVHNRIPRMLHAS